MSKKSTPEKKQAQMMMLPPGYYYTGELVRILGDPQNQFYGQTGYIMKHRADNWYVVNVGGYGKDIVERLPEDLERANPRLTHVPTGMIPTNKMAEKRKIEDAVRGIEREGQKHPDEAYSYAERMRDAGVDIDKVIFTLINKLFLPEETAVEVVNEVFNITGKKGKEGRSKPSPFALDNRDANIAKQGVVKKCNEEDKQPGKPYCIYKHSGDKIQSPQPKGWPKHYKSKEAADKALQMMKTFGEKIGQKEEFECQECGKVFSKKIPASLEVKCPGCGSYDVYPLSQFSRTYPDKEGKVIDPLLSEYIAGRKEAIDPRSIEYYSEYYKDTGYDRGLTEKQDTTERRVTDIGKGEYQAKPPPPISFEGREGQERYYSVCDRCGATSTQPPGSVCPVCGRGMLVEARSKKAQQHPLDLPAEEAKQLFEQYLQAVEKRDRGLTQITPEVRESLWVNFKRKPLPIIYQLIREEGITGRKAQLPSPGDTVEIIEDVDPDFPIGTPGIVQEVNKTKVLVELNDDTGRIQEEEFPSKALMITGNIHKKKAEERKAFLNKVSQAAYGLGTGYGYFSRTNIGQEEPLTNITAPHLLTSYLSNLLHAQYQFPLGVEIRYGGTKNVKESEKYDGEIDSAVVDMFVDVMTVNGHTIRAEVPIMIREGKPIEPVAMMHEGQPKIISQDVWDGLVLKNTTTQPLLMRNMYSPPWNEQEMEMMRKIRPESVMPRLFGGMYFVGSRKSQLNQYSRDVLEKALDFLEKAKLETKEDAISQVKNEFGFSRSEAEELWEMHFRIMTKALEQTYGAQKEDKSPEELAKEVKDNTVSLPEALEKVPDEKKDDLLKELREGKKSQRNVEVRCPYCHRFISIASKGDKCFHCGREVKAYEDEFKGYHRGCGGEVEEIAFTEEGELTGRGYGCRECENVVEEGDWEYTREEAMEDMDEDEREERMQRFRGGSKKAQESEDYLKQLYETTTEYQPGTYPGERPEGESRTFLFNVGDPVITNDGRTGTIIEIDNAAEVATVQSDTGGINVFPTWQLRLFTAKKLCGQVKDYLEQEEEEIPEHREAMQAYLDALKRGDNSRVSEVQREGQQSNYWQVLGDAVDENRKVRFSYVTLDHRAFDNRVVAPHYLFYAQTTGNDIMVGWDRLRNNWRSFRVAAMTYLEVKGKHLYRKADVIRSLEQFLETGQTSPQITLPTAWKESIKNMDDLELEQTYASVKQADEEDALAFVHLEMMGRGLTPKTEDVKQFEEEAKALALEAKGVDREEKMAQEDVRQYYPSAYWDMTDKLVAEVYSEDILPGGLADGLDDSLFDPEQVAKGIQIELEHTDDIDTAREIAEDHLKEIPDYYDRLEKMEEDAQGENEELEPKKLDVVDTVEYDELKGKSVAMKEVRA